MASPVQIYLSSSDATQHLNGTLKSDMLFLFKSPIVPPPTHFMTLRLVNAYVPISFTIINDTNDQFELSGTSYTIPHGNYTAVELGTLLMILTAYDDPTFTVEFSQNTGKFTFSSAVASKFTIDGTCLKILGLPEASSATDYELVSVYPADLTGQNILYVDVKNLTTFNLSSSTKARTSIIGSILVNVQHGSVLYYEDTGNTQFTIQEDSISFLHIRLYGEDMTTLLDLNDFSWALTLEVGFVEKTLQPTIPSTYKDLYKDYITQLLNKRA